MQLALRDYSHTLQGHVQDGVLGISHEKCTNYLPCPLSENQYTKLILSAQQQLFISLKLHAASYIYRRQDSKYVSRTS